MKKAILPLMIVALAACTNYKQDGLTNRINEFSRSACNGATVTRYDYDGIKLYLFDDNCNVMDGGADVTDENGKSVCYLGGFTGELKCLGKRFDSTAKNPQVVYRK